ncbi:MAG: VCBS domain-containing protein, partial [Candidatus Thermoplasmatota archaeon]|nr:VCBS domain-containing protein [Candidatus Thermoplasmatota archaeon]
MGNYVRVYVTYTDEDSTQESHSGAILSTISNADDDNTAVPTFSGTTTEAQTLTADYTPLSGNDEDGTTDADANSGAGYSYQWHRCTSTTASTCSSISGATSATYLLAQADVGKYIRVAVSYTDDYSAAETVNSAINSNAIANINDVATISGANTGAITEDASPNTVTGTPTVVDEDSGQDTLLDVSSTDSVSGYGSFAVSSGTWTYTLDNTDSTVNALDSGSTAITDTFVVTSADGGTTMTVTVTISGANDAPTITSSAVTSVNEDAAYTYTVTAADVDSGDTITLTGTTVPSWATFTASTGVLAGTPLNANVGANSVVI